MTHTFRLQRLARPGSRRRLPPVAVDFYLYFPSRLVADLAAAELGEEGFIVEKRDEPEEGWLAVAGDVAGEALEATEKRLRQVAESHGGVYEGFKGD
jgi:hypothetical protein